MKIVINNKARKPKLYDKLKVGRCVWQPSKTFANKKLINIGEAIREVRLLRGMTQKELGVAVGFAEKTADIRIAQYETGKRNPKKDLLVKIEQALQCHIFLHTYVTYSLVEETYVPGK